MSRTADSPPVPEKKRPPTLKELRRKLRTFCRQRPIARLEVFGSVAEGVAKPGSDVDLMVTFRPETELGLEFIRMKLDLEELLGCPVDLVERVSVEKMKNPF